MSVGQTAFASGKVEGSGAPDRPPPPALAIVFGGLAIAIAVAVLAGWLLRIPVLTSILPTYVSMKPNTAVALAASGLSLLLLGAAQRSAAARSVCRGAALFVAIVGLLSAVEHLSGLDLGIDQLMFEEPPGTVGTLAPGRMSPTTALNFILLGAALLLAESGRRTATAQILGLLVGLTSLFPVVAHIYHARAIYGVGRYAQMAIPTCIAFFLLSAGLLWHSPRGGILRPVARRSGTGWLLRRLLPFAILAPVALAWLQMRGEQAQYFESDVGKALVTMLLVALLPTATWLFAVTIDSNHELKRAFNAQLLAEGARAEQYFALAGVIMVALDKEGRITKINRRGCELLGYDENEIVGKSWFENFTPDSTGRERGLTHRRVMTGELPLPTYVETLVRTRDGSVRTLAYNHTLLRNDKGEILGTLSSGDDITLRVQAEESLRQREAQLKLIIDNLPANVAYLDARDLTYRLANDVLLKNMGRSSAQLIGAHVRDVIGEVSYAAAVPFLERAQRGERVTYENDFDFTPGHRSYSVSYVPMPGPDGSVVGIVVLGVDITDMKAAEGEREKLQLQLVQAQKMESVGLLAGGVAHDFNNMLGAILGYTELGLRAISADHPVHTDLMEIQRAAERSASLIRQLLAFARKQTVAPRVLELNDAIEVMLKLLGRIMGENIDLVWRPCDVRCYVKMDPSQVDQVLANLCVNARDAINGIGKLTIETASVSVGQEDCLRSPDATKGDYRRITVTDTGCGMSKETLARIFEPFFTTKGFGQGTGLGLATVYGIVKQNGGFFETWSELGKGTKIDVYLPAYSDSEDEEAAAVSRREPGVSGATILLVEDEESVSRMARRVLQTLGYSVLSASTPGEALRMARAHQGVIDLLLTDVVMPEMNGADLAKEVQALHPLVACLFMSGYTANILDGDGPLARGAHFLEKPFSFRQLGDAAKKALGDRA